MSGDNLPPLNLETLKSERILEEIARVFGTAQRAAELLDAIGFDPTLRPDFGQAGGPLYFWSPVCQDIANGRTAGGLDALLHHAHRLWPHNEVFRRWTQAASIAPQRHRGGTILFISGCQDPLGLLEL